MITFTGALVLLFLGYLFYGAFVERIFGVKADAAMPCDTKCDGVDYMPLPTRRVFLIQFLNIAGTGPIFGAIMGILFGPIAYIWIVFGCIFAGAVHDYLCGMISVRKGGASLPEIVGDELGDAMRQAMRVLSLVLLVGVGTVFVITPAALLNSLVPSQGWWFSTNFWVTIIFAYFILATLLPIDKVIGRAYPVFGLALLLMAVGVGVCIYVMPGHTPEINEGFLVNHNPANHHPLSVPIFPMGCVTIACGAISGFHATQSPLMSRCLKNERYGRPVFYGAMIMEGVVAMIWAAASIKFADTLPGQGSAYFKLMSMGNPSVVVRTICTHWLGTAGAVLAVLGVVAAPITSGDTAFRSARLIAADFLHMRQHTFLRRIILSLPLFVIASFVMMMDFYALWRYFAWTNQTMAMIMLWTATVWLYRKGKCFWIALIPAVFMTVVSVLYILVAPEGFHLNIL
jgi:carbon starvation protein CstA